MLMGPTGAGKSAIALDVARVRPTVIINADAMQMVSALRVITARPSEQEEAQAEHALYGVLAPHEPTSVAVWLQRVEPVIRKAWEEGKLPLLVGGTGMYIKALMDGLASIPPIPEDIRTRLRNSLPLRGRVGVGPDEATLSPNNVPHLTSPLKGEELHGLLQKRDPIMAARLKPGDTQRILRALEVMEATGISLAEWQDAAATKLFPGAPFHCFMAMHSREEIYARIDRRFDIMMQRGALAEVQHLMDQTPGLPPPGTPIRDWCLNQPPIYRAHGVPELMALIRGEMTREDAIAKARQNTRNYAKRQMTWLRNQLPEAKEVADSGVFIDLN